MRTLHKQQQVEQQVEGGGGEEFEEIKKHGVNNSNYNNKQHNWHKRKKHHSMKDLLWPIEVTAPVFHAEMSELKAELDRNTTQTTAGRTTSEGRRWRGIQEIKKHGVNNNNNNKQHNRHKRKKHHSMEDLLLCIEVTATVSHFEMSELKAELE